MKVIGLTDLGKRAQAVVRDDPHFEKVIAFQQPVSREQVGERFQAAVDDTGSMG